MTIPNMGTQSSCWLHGNLLIFQYIYGHAPSRTIYARPTFEDLHFHLWSAKHAYTLYTNKANCTYRYLKHVCKCILDNKVKYTYCKKINILRLLGEGPMEKCKKLRKKTKKNNKTNILRLLADPPPPQDLWKMCFFFSSFFGFLEFFFVLHFPIPKTSGKLVQE